MPLGAVPNSSLKKLDHLDRLRVVCRARAGMIQRGMVRHGLSDSQWRRLQRVLPKQRAGPGRRPAIASSSMLCSTARTPACRGVTCPSASDRGSLSTNVSRTGLARATGLRSSASYKSTATSEARSSTAPSSVRTRTHRAEKGDPTKCSGPLSRRLFDQAPRARRHQGAATLRHDHAGPPTRDDRRP